MEISKKNESTKKNAKIQVGFATFNDKMTKKLQKQLISQISKKSLSQKKWIFSLNNSSHEWSIEWASIAPYMVESRCQTIMVTFHSFQIMKTLTYPKFTDLKVLDIKGNLIFSLESLAFIDAEKIEELHLSANFLCSGKPLNKTNWTKIEQFFFSQNYIPQMGLGRIRFRKQIKECLLDTDKNGVPLNQDIGALAKLQPYVVLEPFRFFNVSMIKQSSVVRSLASKYKICHLQQQNSKQMQLIRLFLGNRYHQINTTQ